MTNNLYMPNKLLLIDDEQNILDSMKEFFNLHGYYVDCASTIHDAMMTLAANRYTVVVVDINLGPNRSDEGLELVHYVHDRYPNTKIIVLTGSSATEIEERARDLGADYFLVKPKPLPDLAQVIFGLDVIAHKKQLLRAQRG